MKQRSLFAPSSTEFRDLVRSIVARLPAGRRFSTDLVWDQVEQQPDEPRDLGNAMKGLAAAGFIRALDEWVISRRPECKGRPVRVWERV